MSEQYPKFREAMKGLIGRGGKIQTYNGAMLPKQATITPEIDEQSHLNQFPSFDGDNKEQHVVDNHGWDQKHLETYRGTVSAYLYHRKLNDMHAYDHGNPFKPAHKELRATPPRD